MAIEINSRSKYYKSVFSIANILGIICLIFAFIALAFYLFLFFNSKKINQELLKKEAESFTLNQNILEKELEITPIKEKINNFSNLIENHKSLINIFTIIENNCFPNVQFTNLNFDLSTGNAILSAHTDDLITVEEQFASIKKDPLLSNVILSGVSFSGEVEKGETSNSEISENEKIEKGVDFSLELTFKPEVFSK